MNQDMTKLPFIVAVDFDGTLVEDKFPEIGLPRTQLIEELRELMETTDIIFILWTCRDNEDNRRMLDKALDYSTMMGLRWDAVNKNCSEVLEMFHNDTRKVYANLYIDDKAAAIIGVKTLIFDAVQLRESC